MKNLNAFLLGVLACVVAVGGYFVYEASQFLLTQSRHSVKFVEVRPIDSPKTIAKELERQGVVSSARYFYWYGRITGKNKKIKTGDYKFTQGMNPAAVMAVLISGISYSTPFTVPEGLNQVQIAEALEKAGLGNAKKFLKACHDAKFIGLLNPEFLGARITHLEGYLFPDTYFVGRKMSEEDLVRQMIKRYRENFTTEMRLKAQTLGFSEHQMVTLASIIEKETGAIHERPLISSVFHNRLKKKMRLQTDPTVIYGIENYSGNISKKDLETYTPYNTYKISGLPPGPIASPGKASLDAALEPSLSSYLFFVSHNDGTHEFTSTFEEHQKAVAKFQLDRKAREGKSWRQLNQ